MYHTVHGSAKYGMVRGSALYRTVQGSAGPYVDLSETIKRPTRKI
jgi:hypothetical protein